MSETSNHKMTVYAAGHETVQDEALIIEEPLSIRVDGNPYSVVMRTPGDEIPHIAGFCLAEGLIDRPDDVASVGFCDDNDTNVATLTLKQKRRAQVAGLLERKGFVSQTSCGICGKLVVDDLQQILSPIKYHTIMPVDQVMACADMLPSYQPIYDKTRSAHAAMIFDASSNPLSSAEDVGRHNALDKAIGKVFMDGRIENAALVVMSSRLSYELVQKAARAGIEIMVGISRPTALAVHLAGSVDMTLACAEAGQLMLFCGKRRIEPKSERSVFTP